MWVLYVILRVLVWLPKAGCQGGKGRIYRLLDTADQEMLVALKKVLVKYIRNLGVRLPLDMSVLEVRRRY